MLYLLSILLHLFNQYELITYISVNMPKLSWTLRMVLNPITFISCSIRPFLNTITITSIFHPFTFITRSILENKFTTLFSLFTDRNSIFQSIYLFLLRKIAVRHGFCLWLRFLLIRLIFNNLNIQLRLLPYKFGIAAAISSFKLASLIVLSFVYSSFSISFTFSQDLHEVHSLPIFIKNINILFHFHNFTSV